MRAVDTNILVRLIARDDGKQVAAAERFIKPGAWIPLLVLQESLWVLERAYALGRKELASVVAHLLDHETLAVEAPALVADALAKFTEASRVGFSDCLILASTRLAGHTPLGTFDKRLGRLKDVEIPT